MVQALLADQAEASRVRLEIAMDGVKAHIAAAGTEPKVNTTVVRQLPNPSSRPIRSAVEARRYVFVLGSIDELARRINATIA